MNANRSIFTILTIALLFVSVLSVSADAASYSRSASSSTTYSRGGTAYSSTGYVAPSSVYSSSNYVVPTTNYNSNPTTIVSTPTPTVIASTPSSYRTTSTYSTQPSSTTSSSTSYVSDSSSSRSSSRTIGLIPSTTPSALGSCAVNSDCSINSVVTVPNGAVLKFTSLTIGHNGVISVENGGTIYFDIAETLTVNGKITANGANGSAGSFTTTSSSKKGSSTFGGLLIGGLIGYAAGNGNSGSVATGAVVGGTIGYIAGSDGKTTPGTPGKAGSTGGKIVVQAKDVIVTGSVEAIGGNGGAGEPYGAGAKGGQVIIQADEIFSSPISNNVKVNGGTGSSTGSIGSKDVSDGYALSKIILSPATAFVKSGSSQKFSATLYDKRNRVVLDVVPGFSVSNSSRAKIENTHWSLDSQTTTADVVGKKAGQVTVTVWAFDVSTTASIEVTPGDAILISIAPRSATINYAETTFFDASAYDSYENELVLDNNEFIWSSTGIAGTVNAEGLYSGNIKAGTDMVTATYSGVSNSALVTVLGIGVTANNMQGITFDSMQPTLSFTLTEGATIESATIFSDPIDVTSLITSTNAKDFVLNLREHGYVLEEGDHVLNITVKSITTGYVDSSNSFKFKVKKGIIDHISLSRVSGWNGSIGSTPTFYAVAIDVNGNYMQSTPVWTVPTGATIVSQIYIKNSGRGELTVNFGTVAGDKIVSVSTDGITESGTYTLLPNPLNSINLTVPSDSVVAGQTLQFAAGGLDEYGNSVAIAPTYSTTSGSIDANGLLTAPTVAGTITVTVISGDTTATQSITVVADALDSIIVTAPSNNEFVVGLEYPFVASGFDQYGNSVAFTPVWTTSSGSITQTGLVPQGSILTAPTLAGSVTVTASSGSISGSETITLVPDVIADAVISPVELTSIDNHESQQFSVVDVVDQYGNSVSSVNNILFAVTGSIGSIDTSGLFSATNAGVGSIDATVNKDGTAVYLSKTLTVNDVDAPVITLQSPADGSAINPGASIEYALSDDVGINFGAYEVFDSSLTHSFWFIPYPGATSLTVNTTSLPAGPITVIVNVSDAAGNQALLQNTFTINDVISPVINSVSTTPVTPIEAGTQLLVEASVSDNVGVASVEVFGAQTIASGPNAGQLIVGPVYYLNYNSSTGLYSNDLSVGTTGLITLNITAKDSAGNTVSITNSVLVQDTTAPLLVGYNAFTKRRAGQSLLYNAQVADVVGVKQVNVSLNGVVYPMSLISGDQYQANLSMPTIPGIYAFSIDAVDYDGNSANLLSTTQEVVNGEPYSIVLTEEPTFVVAGQAAIVSAHVEDAYGNPVNDSLALVPPQPAEITFTQSSGPAVDSITPGTIALAANGNASAIVVTGVVPGVVNITATAGSITQTISIYGQGGTGALQGYVLNASSGLPLSDALVSVLQTSFSGVTDANGFYSISGIPVGTYSALASKAFFTNSQQFDLVLASGTTLTTNFTLTPTGSFSFTIQDDVTLTNLNGATVQVINGGTLNPATGLIEGGTVLATCNTVNGLCSVQVAPGVYNVMASSSGYLGQALMNLGVSAGQVQNILIQLSSLS